MPKKKQEEQEENQETHIHSTNAMHTYQLFERLPRSNPWE